jgi:hypothetical protein
MIDLPPLTTRELLDHALRHGDADEIAQRRRDHLDYLELLEQMAAGSGPVASTAFDALLREHCGVLDSLSCVWAT